MWLQKHLRLARVFIEMLDTMISESEEKINEAAIAFALKIDTDIDT